VTYHTTDTRGVSEINPNAQRMRTILESVRNGEGAEHPDVWLTNDESGWMLTYTDSGVMILENLDNDEARPRYLRKISVTRALELWQLLAVGELRPLLELKWSKD